MRASLGRFSFRVVLPIHSTSPNSFPFPTARCRHSFHCRGHFEDHKARIERTDSSGLDHVADGEALDGLVLGGAASAVGATHRLDVAAAILVAAAIKSISYRAP